MSYIPDSIIAALGLLLVMLLFLVWRTFGPKGRANAGEPIRPKAPPSILFVLHCPAQWRDDQVSAFAVNLGLPKGSYVRQTQFDHKQGMTYDLILELAPPFSRACIDTVLTQLISQTRSLKVSP